jgi:hypothetical protein
MIASRPAMVLSAVAFAAAPGWALADEAHLEGELAGSNVVPPVASSGVGTIEAVLNTESNEIVWFIDYRQLSGPVTAIRLHGPAAAGENAETLVSPSAATGRPILGGTTVTSAVAEHLMEGLVYLVLATAAFPEGELRAQLIVASIEAGGGGDD